MTDFITHLHSGLRYVILALLLYTIFQSVWSLVKKQTFSPFDRVASLLVLIVSHIQLLTGILLYFISAKVVFNDFTMKIALFRFFTVEHPLMMIIAVALITVGFSRLKRISDDAKHKNILIFYSLGLAVILAAIPWGRF